MSFMSFAVLNWDSGIHIVKLYTSFTENAKLLLVSFLQGFKWGQDLPSSAKKKTTFAKSSIQPEGSAWLCEHVTDLWTSKGLCQDHAPVILIPSQISLPKQTDVDGWPVWMFELWKIYSSNIYSLFIPLSSPMQNNLREQNS